MSRLFIDDDGQVLLDVADLTLRYEVRAADDVSARELVDGAVAAYPGPPPAAAS